MSDEPTPPRDDDPSIGDLLGQRWRADREDLTVYAVDGEVVCVIDPDQHSIGDDDIAFALADYIAELHNGLLESVGGGDALVAALNKVCGKLLKEGA